MTILLIGLILFLGTHSVRVYANDWRNRQISLRGENIWMGLYSILSLAGLILIVWGYGQARLDPQIIWQPPVWTRHLAALLTLPAFILLVATYVPGTKLKTKVGHPMILGVKLWAFAHLLANGNLADIILFGAFLVWAVFVFRAARQRTKAMGVQNDSAGISRDIVAVVVGIVAWVIFALMLHNMLIGVKPFG